jgi:hypothetical protein
VGKKTITNYDSWSFEGLGFIITVVVEGKSILLKRKEKTP